MAMYLPFPQGLLRGRRVHGLFVGASVMAVLTSDDVTPYVMQYFDLGIAKADPEASESAPWLIYIQASTPAVDFEKERVLQQALKDSCDYFLENGKITYEHVSHENRHDASVLIGEPMAVKFTPNGLTLIQARLYPYQEQARNVYNILRSGGKLKASIGGSCSKRPGPDGVTEIDRIFWNHVAITSWPVNDDTLVSLQPLSAFLKALGSASAAPLVQEDLQGAREAGTPALAQRWQALTEILMQRQPGLSEARAREIAALLLRQRGALRPAYTTAVWSPLQSLPG
jgi:hypothetical protein